MRTGILRVAAITATFAQVISAAPQARDGKLQARQSINFDLVESAPDPVVQPDDTSNYNPAAAIASVIADIRAGDVASERKRALKARDIVVSTYTGYTANIALGNAAINAPLDCNGKDTYMGVKLFTESAFDTSLCAAACTAQTEYNRAHPPADGRVQTCQFYNTYALYKNEEYEGQYCSLYNQTWAATYATNDGQWRGDDHYTIRSSYIASNAANPGVCPTAAPVPAQCTNRAIRLCCLNIAPWATNSGVWGGICGYTPSNPSELIGARCIPRPATGSCPAGTSQACCAGTVPGQCALGTQCARV